MVETAHGERKEAVRGTPATFYVAPRVLGKATFSPSLCGSSRTMGCERPPAVMMIGGAYPVAEQQDGQFRNRWFGEVSVGRHRQPLGRAACAPAVRRPDSCLRLKFGAVAIVLLSLSAIPL